MPPGFSLVSVMSALRDPAFPTTRPLRTGLADRIALVSVT